MRAWIVLHSPLGIDGCGVRIPSLRGRGPSSTRIATEMSTSPGGRQTPSTSNAARSGMPLFVAGREIRACVRRAQHPQWLEPGRTRASWSQVEDQALPLGSTPAAIRRSVPIIARERDRVSRRRPQLGRKRGVEHGLHDDRLRRVQVPKKRGRGHGRETGSGRRESPSPVMNRSGGRTRVRTRGRRWRQPRRFAGGRRMLEVRS